MGKIYVAGPMRGKENYNFDNFDRVANELRDAGWRVISPAAMDRMYEGWGKYPPDSGFEHGDLVRFIRRDISAILELSPPEDAIYMMAGYENSKGAMLELSLANFLGLSVFYEEGHHE